MGKVVELDVLGTCQSVASIAEKYGISQDDVEELLANQGIDLCTGCGWWFEVSELIDDEEEDVGCVECR